MITRGDVVPLEGVRAVYFFIARNFYIWGVCLSPTSFVHAPLTLSYHLFQGTQGPKGNTGPPGANGQAVSYVLQFINFTLKMTFSS